jgi:hypothetical protein
MSCVALQNAPDIWVCFRCRWMAPAPKLRYYEPNLMHPCGEGYSVAARVTAKLTERHEESFLNACQSYSLVYPHQWKAHVRRRGMPKYLE